MPIEASRLEDVGVANRPLSPRDCRRRSGRSKTAKRKPGASKNDKKCANLYISGDETRFQHKLKTGVFDGPCYLDSEKNNGFLEPSAPTYLTHKNKREVDFRGSI